MHLNRLACLGATPQPLLLYPQNLSLILVLILQVRVLGLIFRTCPPTTPGQGPDRGGSLTLTQRLVPLTYACASARRQLDGTVALPLKQIK
jgi:hypothetical protein